MKETVHCHLSRNLSTRFQYRQQQRSTKNVQFPYSLSIYAAPTEAIFSMLCTKLNNCH